MIGFIDGFTKFFKLLCKVSQTEIDVFLEFLGFFSAAMITTVLFALTIALIGLVLVLIKEALTK